MGRGTEGDDKLVLKLKQTRRAFLPEYFCGAFLLGLWIWMQGHDVILKGVVNYFLIGLALLAIITAEFSRLSTRYKLMQTKLVIINGVLKNVQRNVYFQPLAFLPDLNMRQSQIERFLGYGTVYMQGGASGTFEIKNVNSPQKVLAKIRELIKANSPH